MDLTQPTQKTDSVEPPEQTHRSITEVDLSELDGGLRLPTSRNADVSHFWGGYVHPPIAGLHENVIYPDLSSLYPNLIRTLNMSIETLVGNEDELEASQWGHEDVVNGFYDPRPVKHCTGSEDWQNFIDGKYKAVKAPDSDGELALKWPQSKHNATPQYEPLYFLKPSIADGFIASNVEDVLEYKEQYRETPKYGASKRVVNAIFGFLGFSTKTNESRLFDIRLAEAITMTGRKVIQHTAESYRDRLENEHNVEAKWVAGDTDSAVLSLPELDGKFETLDTAFEVTRWMNTTEYDRFMKELCNVEPQNNHMEVEVESFAPKAFFSDAKKRYFQRVCWED